MAGRQRLDKAQASAPALHAKTTPAPEGSCASSRSDITPPSNPRAHRFTTTFSKLAEMLLVELRALMPRRFLKKITPHPHTLRDRWYLRAFGSRIADPRLWSLQRRSVTAAFGAGLAICFLPLPVHLPLAALIAVLCRLNVPTIVATV